MKHEVKIGQTDYTTLILIRDPAGAPKTALTYASAGIDVCYTRVETDNDVVLTAGAPAETTLTGAHTDWGFVKVDDTNAPGLYKLDLADGVFATGAWSAVVSLICTGCDPVHIEFILVPQAPADGVNVATITANAITAAAINDGAIDNATFAADVGSTALATNIIAKAAEKAIGVAGAELTAINLPNQTMDITGNITGNLSGSVGSVTGAVGSVTGAVGSVTGAVGSVTGAVGSVTGNVGGNVTGSVGSVVGDTKQTADVAALITTVGVAGAGLTVLATQASVNTIDDFLDTEVAAILADTNELQTNQGAWATATGFATATNLATVAGYLDTEIAAILADTNELQTDWVNDGRLDLILDIIAADTTTDIPALIGVPAGASVSADIAAIEAQTDDIGIAGVGLTAVPWNAAWDAEVQSEVIDALQTAIAEMAQGIPPATPTLQQAIMYLYMAWRNKTETTATNLKVFNDAGTAVAQATLSDDATTFTKTEFISGA